MNLTQNDVTGYLNTMVGMIMYIKFWISDTAIQGIVDVHNCITIFFSYRHFKILLSSSTTYKQWWQVMIFPIVAAAAEVPQ